MTPGRLAIAAILVLAMSSHRARAGSDDDAWFGRDKALHFSFSAALAAGGYAGASLWTDDRGSRLLVGGGVAVAAGVGKELFDLSGQGDASARDLTWDLVGAATGLLIAWTIDRLLVQPVLSQPASRRGAAP